MNDSSRAGVLLVGGRSVRMGTPKTELTFGRETLFTRSLAVLRQVVPRVVVVRAADQTLPDLPGGVRLVTDDLKGQGPLEGLRAGLAAATDFAECACVTAVDVPFLEPAFLDRLFALLGSHDAVIPEQAGRRHPLSGCYRTSVAHTAQTLLREGERSVQMLLDRIDTRVVGAERFRDCDPDLLSLRNVNTPEEYRRARTRYESGA